MTGHAVLLEQSRSGSRTLLCARNGFAMSSRRRGQPDPRRIGQGRADPIISPDWTSMERPVSHTDIRWGNLEHSDIDDDHVGRPFPPVPKRSLD